jgi:hypothetical protein
VAPYFSFGEKGQVYVCKSSEDHIFKFNLKGQKSISQVKKGLEQRSEVRKRDGIIR